MANLQEGIQKVSVNRQVRFTASRDNSISITTNSLDGRDYKVIPSIILVEGVLFSSNAEHPALALASEFGVFPQGWNGRPVVYNHPMRGGEPVSANSPSVWESEVIGYLFGTTLKDNKKLLTNVWLDTAKAPKEVLDIVDQGGSLEVSTGLFTLEEETSGTFQGESYSAIWRNIVPDHLAILEPGSIGACSIEDGCGLPRINSAKGKAMSEQAEVTPVLKDTPEALPPVRTNCGSCPGA